MDKSLILLLVFIIACVPVSYYFGWVRPPRGGAWRHQAAFLIEVFMLIPLTCFVLLNQSGAIERLELAGVSAHPSIIESIGYQSDFEWLFKASDSSENILDYYRSLLSQSDWELTTDSQVMLIFRRGNQKMVISASGKPGDTTLLYSISEEKNL